MSTSMPSIGRHGSGLRKTALIAASAAASTMVAIGIPLALAAPTAVPPSDAQGYVDSTARCAKPDTAVLFGTTETSRVAICKTAAGTYEYRGVRVRDGAKLITTATKASDSTFVAGNDDVTYTVTPTALSITAGGGTYRNEAWLDYHGVQAPAASSSASSKASTSAAPTTSSAAPTSTAGPASSTPKTTAATASSAVPLPPPLPAEVGGSAKTG